MSPEGKVSTVFPATPANSVGAGFTVHKEPFQCSTSAGRLPPKSPHRKHPAAPNISWRNGADGVQSGGIAIVRAGHNLPRNTIPVFDDGAGWYLIPHRPYVVCRQGCNAKQNSGWCGDPFPLLTVEMHG